MSPELEKPLRTEAEAALAAIYRVTRRKDWRCLPYGIEDAAKDLEEIAILSRHFREDPSS